MRYLRRWGLSSLDDLFSFGKIPEGIDEIWAKKEVSAFMKQARMVSKPDKCIVCGKQTTRFCNSHSVPKMILRSIAENGQVMQANGVMGADIIEIEKGVNNSGTFQFICQECDSTLFQTYENPDNLMGEKLSDKLLSEIALKDVLLMLSKRNVERAIFRKGSEMGKVEGIETMYETQDLDVRDYRDEMNLYLSIDDNSSNCFQVVFHMILPYVTPIAVQTALVLQNDLEGGEINNIYDYSPDVRIQNMHISVFPLKDSTVVIMFYHKRDKNYRRLLHQFNCLSDEKKLSYINYWIFKYTENYFFAPSFKKKIEENPKLIQLSRENNELPNLGYVNLMTMLQYEPVKIDEVPNLLKPEYAMLRNGSNGREI